MILTIEYTRAMYFGQIHLCYSLFPLLVLFNPILFLAIFPPTSESSF